jgi:1-acyl-sn-glycerol-3-phosphate acyltransferase
MKPFLVGYRTLAFCLLTAGYYSLWLVGLIFVLGNETRQYQWRNWGFRKWAKSMLVALGINLNVEGISPATPCLLVTNHLSYLDIVILAARFDCVFVAKSEVANWPIIGFLCQSMATIFIDRNRTRDILRVNQLIENALLSGKSVMFFPEGTTTAGASVLPFKSALFEPAVRTNTPVVVASLDYQTLPADEDAAWSVCWWGEMKFVPHLLGVFGLTGIRAQLNFGAKSLRSNNRKQLAKAAEWEVRRGKFAVRSKKQFAVDSSRFAVKTVHQETANYFAANCELFSHLGAVCNHCK